MSEFSIIKQYFSHLGVKRADVVLGSGDDAAIVSVPEGFDSVTCLDSSVAGKHFFTDAPAQAIGYKSLIVSVSDIAAMGGVPAWATMGLTLPKVNEQWIAGYAQGVQRALLEHGMALIGGDLTQGPLCITSQVEGYIEKGKALRRSTAQVGDAICVSGPLGGAGLALRMLRGELADDYLSDVIEALYYPQAQVALGRRLLRQANACIDISDGLYQDLGHILEASGVGADINLQAIPIHRLAQSMLADASAWQLALTSGDDYQLCFTIPESQRANLEPNSCLRIGTITAASGCRLLKPNGQMWHLSDCSYQHFMGA